MPSLRLIMFALCSVSIHIQFRCAYVCLRILQIKCTTHTVASKVICKNVLYLFFVYFSSGSILGHSIIYPHQIYSYFILGPPWGPGDPCSTIGHQCHHVAQQVCYISSNSKRSLFYCNKPFKPKLVRKTLCISHFLIYYIT